MTSKEHQYKLLIRQYDTKRTHAMQDKKTRDLEVYAKIPSIAKIDASLNRNGIALIRSMLHPAQSKDVDSFRQDSNELLRTKKMLLVENGYSENYLDVHYDCNACEDTGFIKNKPCKCFNQNLINLAYEQSNLKNILSFENFNNFNFDFYTPEKDPQIGRSPRKNMENIYQASVGFVEKFELEKGNLLFYGPTGLGKTFLCNCIAKELLDSGYNVLYLTAVELFKLFDESRFHRDDMLLESKNILDTLNTVDLLIIDDLGTEFGTSFTAPDIFGVLNNRYLTQKSTIISTNLDPNEWKDLYSERVASRIFGNYTAYKFFGTDVRLLKKYGRPLTP
ncbi:MAG: ATP-binding protein [Cellulosilyticaceae bacterium]